MILEDPETGYKYQGIIHSIFNYIGRIVRESEEDREIDTAKIIRSFVSEFKSKRLSPYLKSETLSEE